MILKSNAIVLAISAFSQTSHIITWLTRDYGRVTTAAKGACRVKSALLGQYDLFYTNELLFYRRSSHNGIHAIRECAPLNFREELRADWRAASAARYLTDLTARLSVSTAAREVYDDLSHALDVLCNCEHSSIESLIFWYEMRLLRHHGIAPDFTICPQCRSKNAEWLRFSISSGRLICPHNTPSTSPEQCITLHRDVVKLLRRFGKCEFFKACQFNPIMKVENKNDKKTNLVLGLSRFLGIFIVFHLDVPVFVRRSTFEILNSQPTLL
jgi:DNA repair protein RecO